MSSDVSLAAFDDFTLDRSSRTHLTSVVQPSYEMGACAATLLMDRIEGRLTGDPVVHRFVPKLVIRDSTHRYQADSLKRSVYKLSSAKMCSWNSSWGAVDDKVLTKPHHPKLPLSKLESRTRKPRRMIGGKP